MLSPPNTMRPLAEKLDQKRTRHKGFLGLGQEMHYRVEFFNPEMGVLNY